MDVSPRPHETATQDGHHGAEPEGRQLYGATRPVARNSTKRNSKHEVLDRVLDAELPRYADVLQRLGQ